MKSKFLTAGAVAAAALALGAFASPAAAGGNISYTFGTPSGGAYCDGVTMTSTNGQSYQGFHVNSTCAGDEDAAGGLAVKVGSTKVVEMVTTVDNQWTNTPIVFYLDTKHKAWYLYLNEYPIGGSNAYVEINAGTLIKGAPAGKGNGVSSTHAKPGAKIDKMPMN